MSGETKQLNADEVTMDFGGRDINKGTADGEFLTIEFENANVEHVTGTSGELVVSGNAGHDTVIITVKVLQTSDANDVFEEARRAWHPGGTGRRFRSLFIRDRNGRALYRGPFFAVKAPPNPSYDRSAKANEWKLVGKIDAQIKGSSPVA